jgi:hypothetical protein
MTKLHKMKKGASKNKGSDCEKQQLDKEIEELMKSLEKQNALLSGYYEKITKSDKERGSKQEPAGRAAFVKQRKDC